MGVGVKKFTGGRGVTVGPILTNRSDIFCDNERGENFLWKNNLDGTFKDVAASANIEDRYQNGRGVAHFGLGREVPVKLEVLFPDGRWMTKDLTSDVNKVIKVKYSKSESSVSISN